MASSNETAAASAAANLSDSSDSSVGEVEDAVVGEEWRLNKAKPSAQSQKKPTMEEHPSSAPNASQTTEFPKTCQEYFVSKGNKKAFLLSMCLGLKSTDQKRFLGDPDTAPYKDLKPRDAWKCSNTDYAAEIRRRCEQLENTTVPRCSNWNNKKLKEWLVKNPIKSVTCIRWLLMKENALYHACLNASKEDSQVKEAVKKTSNWSHPNCYLRMYCCAMEDDVRRHLVKSQQVLSQQELDAQKNVQAPPAFFEALKKKWNDSSYVAITKPLTVHSDFNEPIEIPFESMPGPVSSDFIKKKWNDAKMKLTRVVARWERSGNGFGQLADRDSDSDDDENSTRVTSKPSARDKRDTGLDTDLSSSSEDEIQIVAPEKQREPRRKNYGHFSEENLLAGDNRAGFVWKHKAEEDHLLYLWNEADENDILSHVIVYLSNAVAATGEEVATDTSKPNKKPRKSKDAGALTTEEQASAIAFRDSTARSMTELGYQAVMENHAKATQAFNRYKIDYIRSTEPEEKEAYKSMLEVERKCIEMLEDRMKTFK